MSVLNSKNAYHYHLDTKVVCRSSLSDANRDRSAVIYLEAFYFFFEPINDKLPKKTPKR